MRQVQGGEFMMGTNDPQAEADERPAHQVKVNDFYIGETEVTQELYWEIMESAPSYFKETDNISDLPVESVSWNDAMKFCNKLTKRLPKGLKASLPTEAQWEYACRAGTKTPFYFGSDLNGNRANCDGNSPYGTFKAGKYLGRTTPVKSYGANPWGLYDTHGNVSEWCLDYHVWAVVDPQGSDDGSYRVCRGGSWFSCARYCRSAFRLKFVPSYRGDLLGFRVILSCD